MSRERLAYYAACYTDDPAQPLVSPLFGPLRDLPPSLLFVGGDEVMLDDTLALHRKLLAGGCSSRLTVAPGLWHAYLLYHLKERKEDLEKIQNFVREVLSCPTRT